jgi:hypothetical protein
VTAEEAALILQFHVEHVQRLLARAISRENRHSLLVLKKSVEDYRAK